MSTTSEPRSISGPHVVCAGIIVADHLCPPLPHVPEAGELLVVDRLVLAVGGCAANAAVNLARLKVPTRVVCKVGPDLFGRFVLEMLEREGLDTGSVAIDPDHDTSQTLIVNVQGQDRRFIHTFGANASMSVHDLKAAIDPANPPAVFYLGGYLIMPGLDPVELGEFLEWLGTLGVHRVIDVATPGPADYLPRLTPVLPHVDAFLPNDDEAELILGPGEPLEHARKFHEMGAKLVVITRGGEGAVVAGHELALRMGAYPVEFVDGSGGGDAFDAGYIAGIFDGGTLVESLSRAAAQGASCVRGIGTTATIFDRAESDAFLAAHPVSLHPLD
ncbi:carbohydrate kinase family protein [bacterium]|nr:carbohydrate kinase family protein [bacterium]